MSTRVIDRPPWDGPRRGSMPGRMRSCRGSRPCRWSPPMVPKVPVKLLEESGFGGPCAIISNICSIMLSSRFAILGARGGGATADAMASKSIVRKDVWVRIAATNLLSPRPECRALPPGNLIACVDDRGLGPAYVSRNYSADIRGDLHAGVRHDRWWSHDRTTATNHLSIAHRRSVAILDEFIGPKS